MIGPLGWLALTLCMIGNVSSSLGFKKLAESASLDVSWENALRLLLNPWGWLGIGGGVCFLLGYLMLLRTVPISSAYPMVVAMGTIGVVLAGIIFLGERLQTPSAIGILLVLAGVLLVSR